MDILWQMLLEMVCLRKFISASEDVHDSLLDIKKVGEKLLGQQLGENLQVHHTNRRCPFTTPENQVYAI